jgi:RHS repeat-associated protein
MRTASQSCVPDLGGRFGRSVHACQRGRSRAAARAFQRMGWGRLSLGSLLALTVALVLALATAGNAAAEPPPPTNTSPPTITGAAEQGLTLTEHHGSWTNEPTSYTYQWRQCDSAGASCTNISGATSQTYAPVAGDTGHTIRLQETASNAGGASEPASSGASAVVLATFGKTAVGAETDGGMFADYKIVHTATLSGAGSISKLSLFAIPGVNSPSPQALKAVIYADSEGSPGELLATGTEVTYRGNVNGSGWFDLPFASPVAITAGTYWLGFIDGSETEGMGYAYDEVSNSRAYNENTFSSGPTNPFGSATKDDEQASIYATYTPAPTNTSPPTITGTAQQGLTLTEHHGSWTHEPTSYTYQWEQCNSLGESCLQISGATSQTYVPVAGDVGHTLRVEETATNASGSGRVASAATAVVTSPACTDTWTGSSEGAWTTAANWSAEHVPGSTDVACIGAGKTVNVTAGGQEAKVVQGEGALVISGGLATTSALEASSIAHVTVSGGSGKLNIAGELDVTSSLAVKETPTIEGAGRLVVKPGASGTFGGGAECALRPTLRGITLLNEGTITMGASGGTHDGAILMWEGAQLENTGTFNVDSVYSCEGFTHGYSFYDEGGAPSITNTGTFHSDLGSGNEGLVGVDYNNNATTSVQSGTLKFSGEKGSATDSTWSAATGATVALASGAYELAGEVHTPSGALGIVSGSVTAASASGGASVSISAGTLSVPSGVSSLGTLAVSGGSTKVNVGGELDVTSSLAVKETPTIEGAGRLVVKPGASGTFGGGAECALRPTLRGITLLNEGTITMGASGGTHDGAILMWEGAQLENTGTFNVDSVYSCEGFTHGYSFYDEGGAPSITNTGTFHSDLGSGNEGLVGVDYNNNATTSVQSGTLKFSGEKGSATDSTWSAATGATVALASGAYELAGEVHTPSGALAMTSGEATATSLHGTASVNVIGGTLNVPSGVTTLGTLALSASGAKVNVAGGELDVSTSLLVKESPTLEGAGRLVVKPGATGIFGGSAECALRPVFTHNITLLNEGTITMGAPGGTHDGTLLMGEGAQLDNAGTFNVDAFYSCGGFTNNSSFYDNAGTPASIVNTGTFQWDLGSGNEPYVGINFTNAGSLLQTSGKLIFLHPMFSEGSSQYGGPENPSTPGQPHPTCGDPVTCATGNLAETQVDLSIGGRGVGLKLERIYNSQAAAAGTNGAFGYGWSSSFSDHLIVEPTAKLATLVQANGSTVPFAEGTGGSYTAPSWTQDTLTGSAEAGYTVTLANQIRYHFAGSGGRLESVTDRNANATTLSYGESGRLEAITDPAGRKITLTYTGEGLIKSAKDPMGHVVKYAYEGANLASVTEPGETEPRWSFKYDNSHQLSELTDGRGGKTTNEYNSAHQVVSQTDPLKHVLSFAYEPFDTKITNHATGSVTDEHFTSNYLPVSITHGFGTASATSESFSYDAAGNVLSTTDGNGHTTKYGYDAASNRTSALNPDKNETKWTYDVAHDVETTTTPNGETTTIERDAHGNATKISRPAPASTTQVTKYKYAAHGELESVEDPLKHLWKYEYDANGDRTAQIDPEADKRTWTYNEDSQQTSTVSPRGHAAGAEEAKFTTTIERDAQGRPILVTAPLKHETKYTYDPNGNLASVTDPQSNKTAYTFDADNEPIKVEQPNKAATETGYDGAGKVTSQTDADKHTTTYVRDLLEQVTEVVDPLARKTTQKYDAAGNLITLTDAAKRTASYKYDPANRLSEVDYSDGTTPTVKYEYDADGDRTKMVDGTGTSQYAYDQLDRLTESKDGHGNVSSYEYDLANDQTKITYPNGKAVTRAYDDAGRLKSTTDWLEHTTKFAYDASSDLTATAFPTATSNEDTYAYDEAGAMSEVKMAKGAETLASLVYARNKDGAVTKATTVGLPGEAAPGFTYDENSRLTKGAGITYEYDAANNPTKIGTPTYAYDNASQLETGTGLSYTYDELGQRTQVKPTSGPATKYGYDQAGNLTSVARVHEGEVAAIEDSYGYDGSGLRASQTISGTTSYLSWDETRSLPLILSDGTNSYIYGSGSLPIEQISSGGTVTYLHHDQQGSTRMLTGSTGTITGSTTFDAYGNRLESTGTATSALGYDGQYTSADTGLIYLRARTYDPTTAQFLSVDPLVAETGAPYGYASDNPLNLMDPSGLLFGIPGTPSTEEFIENMAENAEKVGTRLVGFTNGFTRPFFGGTAALGLGSLVNTCSAEYILANEIGGYTIAAEGVAGAVYGAVYGAGEAGYAAATKTDAGNSLFGRVYRGVGKGRPGQMR